MIEHDREQQPDSAAEIDDDTAGQEQSAGGSTAPAIDAVAPRTPSVSEQLAALDQRHQSLALDATLNRPGAAEELDQVEAEIAALKRDSERAALAQQERERRDQIEAVERDEARRAEVETKLAALAVQRNEQAREVDDAADRLALALKALLETAAKMYACHLAAGRNRPRARLVDQVAAYLQWRFGSAMGLGRVDRVYRKSLLEIVSGVPAPVVPPPSTEVSEMIE